MGNLITLGARCGLDGDALLILHPFFLGSRHLAALVVLLFVAAFEAIGRPSMLSGMRRLAPVVFPLVLAFAAPDGGGNYANACCDVVRSARGLLGCRGRAEFRGGCVARFGSASGAEGEISGKQRKPIGGRHRAYACSSSGAVFPKLPNANALRR
jgi:hypothetical protein